MNELRPRSIAEAAPSAGGPALSKVYVRGTHRSLAPEETLERLRPFFKAFGITRLADITGLDSIGIPVAVAVRPASRSNITFQGKGLDRTAAQVSAAMEAIETWCAERVQGPILWASATEMRGAGRQIVAIDRLPMRSGARMSGETRILWFEGRRWPAGDSCWLPFETVHTNFTLPAPAGSGHFVASTNGLASGNERREALVHALCELIERDAQALFALEPASFESRRLDLRSIDQPEALAVLERITESGFAVGLWDITSDIGIAAFKCHIMERRGGPGLMPLPAEGHGCHPDRGIALLRAVLEAVQSRATVIAGSRDDVGPALYARFDDTAELDRWRERLASDAAASRYDQVPHAGHPTLDGDVTHIERRLQAAGMSDIVVADLQADEAVPAAVLRVVVPGLEGPPGAGIGLGGRAARRMERGS